MKNVVVLAALALVIILSSTCSQPSNIIWQRRYDSGQEDFGRAVAADGNDVIVGGYWRDTTGGQYIIDWQILRYDGRGNLLWHRTYDSGNEDWLSDIMVDSSHDIVAVGTAKPDSSDSMYVLLVKFSPQGDVIWDKLYAPGLASEGMAVHPDRDGGIIVCGYTYQGADSSDLDILLAQFDRDGGLVHQETLNFGADETGEDVVRDHAGNVVLVGSQAATSGDSTSTADLLIVKLTPGGKTAWRRIYDSGEDDLTGRIAIDSANSILLSVTFTGDEGSSVRLLKYDPEGEIVSDKLYADQRNAACMAIQSGPDGSIIGVGAAGPDDAQRFLVFKYEHNWFTSLLDPLRYHHGDNDLAYGVAFDADGNILLTGASDPGTDPDILTIKLRNPKSGK